MSDLARSTPLRAAFVEQVRAVGLAIRREALVLAVVLAALTAIGLAESARVGEAIDYPLEVGAVIAAVAFLFPFAVWKGERIFGGAHLWGLPVDRRRHAFVKVAAGYVWVVALTVATLVWVVSLALATGGDLGETDRLLIGASGEFSQVRWTPTVWQWLTPLTGATVAYLLGSAVVLGVRRPLRWAGAGLVVVFFLAELESGVLEDVVGGLAFSAYGLDYVLTGGIEALDMSVRLPDGGEAVVWRGLPSLERWATATLLWTLVGLAVLWVATFRHRER